MHKRRAALIAALCGGLAASACAQDYPHKPVRLIIPFAPGGSNDIIGRLLATRLTETLDRLEAEGIIYSDPGGRR